MKLAIIKGLVLLLILFCIRFFSSCEKDTPAKRDSNVPQIDTTTSHDSTDHRADSTVLDLASTFQKTYGGAGDEHVWDVQPTSDSGYVIIGSTSSFRPGDDDIYLLKTDKSGNLQWTKTFDATPMDQGYFIKQTADGGFIFGGYIGLYGGLNLLKTDEQGNLQWSNVYDGVGADDVQQTSDGGYVVAGPNSDFSGIHFVKTDDAGKILWSKNYEGGNGGPIVKTTDDGYAIAGFSRFGVGTFNIMLLKTDVDGNLLWSKTYGGTEDDMPIAMKQTDDGGYIIAGWTNSFGEGNDDAYVIKTDADGNLIWSKTYGTSGFEGALEIEQTIEGGYIFSGLTGNYGAGYALVIKSDESGNVTWSKIFGGGKESYSYIHQALDGGYIITSETSAFGAGGSDIYLVKTDHNGNSGCNESSFTLVASTAATQVTIPSPAVWAGATSYVPSYTIGAGGIATTVCSH